MAIQNQGWAYVSGSGAGVPGGSNTQVQYNDAGALQGNANFTFDGTTVEITGNLATSINISASAFYGDGSNLTGVTASAVNVADGPEQAIQFRVDTPVSGEISGSSALMFLTASNTLSGTYAAFTAVTASTIVGGSPLTISASAITVSGDITTGYALSSSQNISASAFYFGPGGRQSISDTSTDMSILAASTGMFISADGGNLTLQGQVAIDTAGVLTASAAILANANPGMDNPNLWISSSNPAFGPGKLYGNMWFGSGSVDGVGQFTGASMQLHNFGYGTELRLRSPSGSVTIQSDAGDTTIKATAGEVILSGSDGVIFHTQGTFNNATAQFNAGLTVSNTVATIMANSSLQNNGVSTFNNTATFNNSASVHNQGINVNNARGTFNSGLTVNNASAIFNDSVTLGDSSGDGVTWNAGSWNMSANSVVTTLKDGVDGIGDNGALMFFTGSGGDFMKFHTSGSAKGIVFPQQTYLSKGGGLSGTLAGPGSFLAIDSDNKVVLATPPAGGGGGGGIFTEINASKAYTTSSLSVGTNGSPGATLHVSSSGDAALFQVDGNGNGTIFDITGSGLVTITGDLNVCHGTASIAHLSGCSNINIHSNLYLKDTSVYCNAFFPTEEGDSETTYGLDCSQVSNFRTQLTAACGLYAADRVGILTDSPTYALDVAGTVGIDSYIYHNGDDDTYLKFEGNELNLVAGGQSLIKLDYNNNTNDKIILNNTNADIDVQIMADDGVAILHTDAATNMVGIGTTTPKVALDTHHSGATNPVNGGLGSKEGGGDVVFYGTGSSLAGAVYYLNEDGGWAQAQSTNVSMATGQLGIALGTNAASDGMLIRGFANIDTFLTGTMKAGKVLYVSHLSPGFMSHTAPTGSGEILRLVGHATSGSSNVIYFNPEAGWLELV